MGFSDAAEQDEADLKAYLASQVSSLSSSNSGACNLCSIAKEGMQGDGRESCEIMQLAAVLQQFVG